MRSFFILILALGLTQCTPKSETAPLTIPSSTKDASTQGVKANREKVNTTPKPLELKPGQTFGLAYSEQEDWEMALTHLSKELENPEFAGLKPKLSFELAKAQFETEKYAEAKATLSNLIRDYKEFSAMGMAYYYLSEIAQKEGNPIVSSNWLTKIKESYPDSEAARLAQADLGIQELKKENFAKAWNLLSSALKEAQTPLLYEKALPHLRTLTNNLFFDRKMIDGFEYYEVKAGDNLSKISRNYQTTPGFIMYMNKLSSTTIRIGQFLKVFKGGPITIQVNKANYSLVVFCGNHYVRDYQIGLGKNDKTPIGKFEIGTKVENPKWYNEGKVFTSEDPQNVLGTRWLGFKNQPGLTGFGIHGTKKPESIGKNESNGCVRMRNDEIEELFPMIAVGTKVSILE